MDVPAAILECYARLTHVYGQPRWRGGDPVQVLVGCILSQSTTDAQSDAAYTALVKRYPTWADLRAARTADIARAIKASGLANEKARYIKNALEFIARERGEISLDFLRALPAPAARRWLMQIHGVGPKTASIVLLFALKMSVFPVDTHVHRVSRRLGWITPTTSADRAHALLEALAPPAIYYPLHVTLIRHGRELCRTQNPRCELCPLTDLCAYYRTLHPQ
jgi:endonuclease-3